MIVSHEVLCKVHIRRLIFEVDYNSGLCFIGNVPEEVEYEGRFINLLV